MANNFELASKIRGFNFDQYLIVSTIYCDLYEKEELDKEIDIDEIYKIA